MKTTNSPISEPKRSNIQEYVLNLGVDITIQTRDWYDLPHTGVAGTEHFHKRTDFFSKILIHGEEVVGYGLSETESLHNLSEKIKLFKLLRRSN